jgi:pSer/pThr/pTyr-binding forkhead associated (FHA) protein
MAEETTHKKRYLIGGDSGADIVIKDSSVSRRHCCLIVLPGGQYEIVDLGSTYGVFLYRNNDWEKVVGSSPVLPQDTIRVGRHEASIMDLLVRLQDPEKLTPATKDKVFISYRRADTEQAAGRLFDRLAAIFGSERIFFDTESIPGAVPFLDRIRSELEQSALVVALIGSNWVKPNRQTWLSKLGAEPEHDFVEVEIETAFGLMIPVIPVLVGSAEMPKASSLSPGLKRVTQLNAISLRSGRDFHNDVDALVATLSRFVKLPVIPPADPFKA